MTYEETLQYLYTSIPVFQNQGASAYKPGLDTSIALANLLDNPQQAYPAIHVAGTNGKGSVSHLLAAVLQKAGYKTGLFTSPHLIDFRERIRVNGSMISKDFVIDFVEKYRKTFEPLRPSFFELTSTMAFAWFREMKVDFAIIETGMGGRLDSTNIITPILSIITNISFDHTQFLGHKLTEIAFEKAGIIKPHIPALIGECEADDVADVFRKRAAHLEAPLFFAGQMQVLEDVRRNETGNWRYHSPVYGEFIGELAGEVQQNNARTVLASLQLLTNQGISIPVKAVHEGFAAVTQITGLMGRWQIMQRNPDIICDTGHNTGGWQALQQQLKAATTGNRTLRMIVGMVNDKDIHGVLDLMPHQAHYYFTQASIERAMPVDQFSRLAGEHGIEGKSFETVREAVEQALADASPDDLIFIGGSTFVVADALPLFQSHYKSD